MANVENVSNQCWFTYWSNLHPSHKTTRAPHMAHTRLKFIRNVYFDTNNLYVRPPQQRLANINGTLL